MVARYQCGLASISVALSRRTAVGQFGFRKAPGGPKATRAAGLEFKWEFIQKGLFLCAD